MRITGKQQESGVWAIAGAPNSNPDRGLQPSARCGMDQDPAGPRGAPWPVDLQVGVFLALLKCAHRVGLDLARAGS